MGIIGWADENNEAICDEQKFYQSGLRHFLNSLQHDPKNCQHLLKKTKAYINKNYMAYYRFFQTLENIELIPLLIAYSLFDWPVGRNDTIGTGANKRKFEVRMLYNLHANNQMQTVQLPCYILTGTGARRDRLLSRRRQA